MMKILLRYLKVSVILIVLLTGNNLMAQRDVRPVLQGDVVKISGENFTIEEYGTISSFDKTYEVKLIAAAPRSLLSRDNFVRYYGALSSSIFATYFSQEGIKAPDDNIVIRQDKPGNPLDLTVTITMSPQGIEYTIRSSNSKSQMTLQWVSQVFSWN